MLDGDMEAFSAKKQSAQTRINASASQIGQVCNNLHEAISKQHANDEALADGIVKTASEAGQKLTGIEMVVFKHQALSVYFIFSMFQCLSFH